MKKWSVGMLLLGFLIIFSSGLIFAEGEEVVAPMIEPLSEGALDNKTFVGELGAKGKEQGDKDEFIFSAGTFRSTACDAYGFTATPYITQAEEDVVTFEADAQSPTDGIMQWRGMIKGDMVEGIATWLKEGQEPLEHWFKGTLKTEVSGN